MPAKDVILSHAAEFGLGEAGQVDLLCNFIDQYPDRLIVEHLQQFLDGHGQEVDEAAERPD